MLALIGPPNSGKTRMSRVLCGLEKPGQGRFSLPGSVRLASQDGFSRRATPLSLAKRAGRTQATANALTATGLWEVRNEPLAKLTRVQLALCEILQCLSGDDAVIVLDSQLDLLDPWTLPPVLELLQARLRAGGIVIISTGRPDWVVQADWVVGLVDQQIKFAGTTADLLRLCPDSEVEVVTMRQEGVRALADPFEFSVKETDTGLVFQASEGQALAARMLLEGYGDVKMVVHRQPKIEDAMRRIR